MFTTTTDHIEGVEVEENLGEVSGLSADTKSIIGDTISDVKDIFGGQMKTNTDLMLKSKESAKTSMIQSAEELGADAIINVRYETVPLATGIGFIAYGTAVKVKSKISDITNQLPENVDHTNDKKYEEEEKVAA